MNSQKKFTVRKKYSHKFSQENVTKILQSEINLEVSIREA